MLFFRHGAVANMGIRVVFGDITPTMKIVREEVRLHDPFRVTLLPVPCLDKSRVLTACAADLRSCFGGCQVLN